MNKVKTTKQVFIDFLFEASESESFVGVLVKLPGQHKPELIVNVSESFVNKAVYFTNHYNEDLTLKTNPEVRILKYAFSEDFNELKKLLEVIEDDI